MAYDANLYLRDGATDLTATANTSSIDFGAARAVPLDGLLCRVDVPAAPTGTTPTLDVKVQESDDNSTWQDLVVFKQITAAGRAIRRFATEKRYVRAVLTVGGTTPNFGKTTVKVGSFDHIGD